MLTTAELRKIKHELGYNVVGAGAEAYISVVAVFEQVIQAYLTGGVATTCSTIVPAATLPTPVALTLVVPTGFNAGERVWIDVDDRQESATIQSASPPAITVLLSKAHTGTYPVTVESGETIVRELLGTIRLVDQAQMDVGLAAGGIKKADEVEFFGKAEGGSPAAVLSGQREHWRRELASALGVVYLRGERSSGGCHSFEAY